MIQIDTKEVQKVRERFPNVHIRRTANKYYVEEAPQVLALLGRGVPARRGVNGRKTPRRK